MSIQFVVLNQVYLEVFQIIKLSIVFMDLILMNSKFFFYTWFFKIMN